MTQAGFKEFWKIAQHWREGCGNGDLPGPAAREFHRAVKRGVDEQRINRGARNYDRQGKPSDPQYQMSAVKWILGWGWDKYADMVVKEYRPISSEERALWEASGAVGPPPEKTEVGKPFWVPGKRQQPALRVVGKQ